MLPRIAPFSSISRPVFTVIFPHKLKYHFFLHQTVHKRLLLNRGQPRSFASFGTSNFSTRSGRERMGSGFGREGRGGSSKSLIEDEAELSDWVSGLSSNSFKKTKMYSDSENETGNVGNRGSRRGERPGKRRRGGEFDKDVDLRRQGEGSSRSREASSGRRKSVDDSEASFGGKFGGRFGRNDGFMSREYDERIEKSGRGRGSRDSNSSVWRGRGEGNGRSRETFSGGKLGGRTGRDDGFMSRGNNERRQSGRGQDMQFRRGRGRGSDFEMESERKAIGRRGLLVTDEEDEEEVSDVEEEDKGYKSFRELIDIDEADEDDNDDDDSDEEEVEVGDDVLVRNEHFSSQSSPGGSDSYLSESRFDECSISPLTLKAIKDAGYVKMTLVQEATLPVILKGKDVMAKAKTGTGKTVAFLLPAIELVAKSPPIEQDQKRPPILVLVVCPTRELATQAAKEADTLLKYHPSIGVQVVIGGTRLPLEQKRMQANPCQILVATPGRLRDHIENTPGFATRLMGVKVVVLDEADHLLDMGFRREIEKIVAAVPKQRQTLLFSATIPQEVRQICHIALKRDHEYINTVQEGSEDTHSQVQQMHIVAPLEKHFPLLYSLLKDHIADDVNYKILVFCTTAMVTKLVAQLLSELNLNVREIHSRKPQTYRTRVSDEFRKSKGLILVTSDVSARGVDYPDVTLVIQIGVPSDRQQYIHRLGRTGRKGKEGQGILLLAPWEEYFLSSIKDLPISKGSEPLVDPDTRKKVERALSLVEMKNKEAAYQAWLGYYNSNKNIGRDKYKLVELANEFSRSMGMDNPPAIPKLVLGKMGLKNIPGLRTK